MSTLSITPEFDALIRTAFDGRPADETVDFGSVFDMDYAQPVVVPRQRDAGGAVRPAVRAVGAVRRPAPAARIRRRRQVVRLTRRGRLLAVLASLGVALTLMTSMGGWATASLTGGTPQPVRIVEVHPGDTLYGIASDLARPGEIRTMVHRIQELNSMPGSSITEGQKLAVPSG